MSAAIALAALAAALPMQLPDAATASSTEACLTIADRPPAGRDAIAALEQCALVVPTDVELLADLGTLYQDAGRNAEAERLFRQVLDLDADYADVRLKLASLLIDRNAVAEARTQLEAALRIQPNRRAIVELMERTK